VPAEVAGYHFESGLALLRAARDLDVDPLPLGDSADLEEQNSVIIAPYGGVDHAIAGLVVSRREFAGSWEYLIDDAIFTAPIHPNWSGAALIDAEGQLAGVGSLWVNDAQAGRRDSPGNMFVPIDLLKPIYEDLVTTGRASTEPRAWLGMYSAEAMGRLIVSGTIPDGPADLAGVEPGDLIVAVAGQPVSTLADMYRRIWNQGGAGTPILLNLRRDGDAIEIMVESANRYDFTKIFRSRH
jgi:S1-C subfamily serine protease